jgi:hypothetical protein
LIWEKTVRAFKISRNNSLELPGNVLFYQKKWKLMNYCTLQIRKRLGIKRETRRPDIRRRIQRIAIPYHNLSKPRKNTEIYQRKLSRASPISALLRHCTMAIHFGMLSLKIIRS